MAAIFRPRVIPWRPHRAALAALTLALFLTLTTAAAGAPSEPAGDLTWRSDCLDCPRAFGALTHGALAVDAAGRLHMAYGGRFLYYALSDGAAWRYETVDNAPWVGGDASLVLDAAGRPHIAYCDDQNSAVKYAYRDDGGWRVERVYSPPQNTAVPAQPASGSCTTTLALDHQGQAHVAFFAKLPHAGLWYARRAGGAWQAQELDFSPYSAGQPSLALDSQDHPSIAAYLGYPSYRLAYAYQENGGWRWMFLHDLPGHDGDMGQYPSLALDAQDRFHISYYDASEGNLEYIHGDLRAYDIELVDVEGDAGPYSSLVLDAAGQPHVSYYAVLPQPGVKYAYRSPEGWHAVAVTAAAGITLGGDTALALDAAGRPFIGFQDDASGVLQVAAQSALPEWTIHTVDRSGTAGDDSSLVLDAAGDAHISYFAAYTSGAASTRLEYTWHDAAGWHRETVAGGQNIRRGSSLALDAGGAPHISYLYGLPGLPAAAGYAYRDGGGWHLETVDASAANAAATAIALDPTGSPHVVYVDAGLRHAYRAAGGWQVETVDPAGDTNTRASLAIDALGRLHVSYRVGNKPEIGATLRYAYRDLAGWHIEAVDGDGDAGEHSSLALDANRQPHIAYYVGYPYHDLRYAYRDGTAWHIETLWATDDSGRFPSLVLDAGGWPHISCHCGGTSDLTHLCLIERDAATVSVSMLAANVVTAGAGTSLALDQAGRPHVTYAFDGGLQYGRYVPWQRLYLPLAARGYGE